MIRLTTFVLSIVISIATLRAEQIKILAIGNSFSEDAIEYYLSGLAAAAGDTVIIGNMYIGGCSLERHYNNFLNNSSDYSYRKIVDGEKITTQDFTLLDAIIDEEWDYISLQQVSSLSGIYESYYPYINSLIKIIKGYSTNPEVEVVLHATWAYEQSSTHEGFANYNNDQLVMYNAIIETMNRVALDQEINIIIPSGTAIQNGRSTNLGDTFCRDGYHLDLNYGRYTASCVWYEKLFQKTVVGNSYIPSNITLDEAKVSQIAAKYAVEIPNEVTLIDMNADSCYNHSSEFINL